MNKGIYQKPEMEFVELEIQDVISASGTPATPITLYSEGFNVGTKSAADISSTN